MGIEPTIVAWEATALPLGHTRLRAEDYRRQGVVCQDNRRRIRLAAKLKAHLGA